MYDENVCYIELRALTERLNATVNESTANSHSMTRSQLSCTKVTMFALYSAIFDRLEFSRNPVTLKRDSTGTLP